MTWFDLFNSTRPSFNGPITLLNWTGKDQVILNLWHWSINEWIQVVHHCLYTYRRHSTSVPAQHTLFVSGGSPKWWSWGSTWSALDGPRQGLCVWVQHQGWETGFIIFNVVPFIPNDLSCFTCPNPPGDCHTVNVTVLTQHLESQVEHW